MQIHPIVKEILENPNFDYTTVTELQMIEMINFWASRYCNPDLAATNWLWLCLANPATKPMIDKYLVDPPEKEILLRIHTARSYKRDQVPELENFNEEEAMAKHGAWPKPHGFRGTYLKQY
jgi:hypothetical protein